MYGILDGNRNRFTRKEQSLLFDLFKALDLTESSDKSDFFSEKTYLFQMCVTCSELPFNISTMNNE